ncbi:MAG: AraC family transcriptional regulator [Comamonas sp.]
MSELHSKSAGFRAAVRHRLQVPDIERSLSPMGEEYIVGDQGVTAATDVLLGQMEVMAVQEGMVLYRTTVQDLCTMRTSNLLYPGIKIALVLEGETELFYGDLRLHLRAGVPTQCGAMLVLAHTDRFMRQWREGRRERKLVLTLTPQWLAQAGVLDGAVQDFMARHLAQAPWQPSARALALADQLHRGRTLPAHLQRLWYQSRCLEIVLEALGSLEQPGGSEGAGSGGVGLGGSSLRQRPTGARQRVRLAALRDWLATPAADGMDIPAIALHAGMSVAHLQRHFPLVAEGQSLGRFLRLQRLQRARTALEQGRLSVAQAAALAGYRSSTHFSAAFRLCFGLRPSEVKPISD